MINTDKYEGHTDDYIWTWKQYASHFDHDADRALIQDAPLLLAEVKQIHEILREAFTSEAKHSGAEYLNMIARVTGLIE